MLTEEENNKYQNGNKWVETVEQKIAEKITDFPGGSLVKIAHLRQREQVRSLNGELRSHMPCGAATE